MRPNHLHCCHDFNIVYMHSVTFKLYLHYLPWTIILRKVNHYFAESFGRKLSFCQLPFRTFIMCTSIILVHYSNHFIHMKQIPISSRDQLDLLPKRQTKPNKKKLRQRKKCKKWRKSKMMTPCTCNEQRRQYEIKFNHMFAGSVKVELRQMLILQIKLKWEWLVLDGIKHSSRSAALQPTAIIGLCAVSNQSLYQNHIIPNHIGVTNYLNFNSQFSSNIVDVAKFYAIKF